MAGRIIMNRHILTEWTRRGLARTLTVALGLVAANASAADYAIGADLSFLKQAEDGGTVFKDQGEAKPGLQIFKDHGYNWIRLRLFHTPTRLPNDLDYTLASARAASAMGFKILLNYHYSDTWADPQKQIMPRAWEGKSHEELVTAVFEYTRDTMKAFDGAGVFPGMVQIGNEVRPGMLWPDGKLPDHWQNFAELLQAGIRGVQAATGTNPPPRIMIHFDQGASRAKAKYFYDNLRSHGVEYDIIGLSYYPWWHGSLLDLRETLHFLATEYDKDIVLVEVAYCWRPAEYREKPGPFPETPEGQREFLDEVHRIVLAIPNNHGVGIFWWEPAVTGRLRARGFFDDDGHALPVLQVFDRFTRH
jgi:arabinogalactan endo-1,4-beta-galactosidase